MRRLFVTVAILAALNGSTPASRAGAGQGSISIGLAEAPSNRADDPRARVYIVDHVAPGTTVARKLRVANDTNEVQKVETYAAAASVKDGEFRFGDGHARNELTTWTTVEPSTASYSPGEQKLVEVTIRVPADASEGERYAVVWASASAAPPEGGGIGATNRVGVRVYLSVGPGGEPASDFEITGIQARRTVDDKPQVAARVRNTGGRALDLSGSLKLDSGPGGLSAGPFNAELGTTLAIGETEPVLVNLDKALPAGPWSARITLKSGLLEHSAKARITFPKKGAGATVRPQTGSRAGAFAAIVAAAILAVLLFLLVRHRRVRS